MSNFFPSLGKSFSAGWINSEISKRFPKFEKVFADIVSNMNAIGKHRRKKKLALRRYLPSIFFKYGGK